MKQLLAACLMLLLFSCNKEKKADVYGDYTGSIDVYINNTKQTALSGHVLRIYPSTDQNSIMIGQNVFVTSIAEFTGNAFSIPRTTVGTGPDMNIVEYGAGTFSGNQLSIELYQELKTSGTLRTTTKWHGTLYKK